MNKWQAYSAAFVLTMLWVTSPCNAAEKTHFRIAWSLYVGWMPWWYADETGILKKWADKYKINIALVQVNDYLEAVTQYTEGGFDGTGITNMDALTIPGQSGVDTSLLVVDDYSNGNDAVILKRRPNAPAPTIADLSHQKVYLSELSVSQYLLSRALSAANLRERDVKMSNASDADIVAAFGTPETQAVVAWNPQVNEILKRSDAVNVYNSSRIPGEILDLLAVNTATLRDNPKLGMALAGAWYEVMTLLKAGGPAAAAAHKRMAGGLGTDVPGFEAQLRTTKLFMDPAEAVAFVNSQNLLKTMDLVRHFEFDHGLLGHGDSSVDSVGILFPNGSILGDTKYIKLRFDDRYMKLAAEGKL